MEHLEDPGKIWCWGVGTHFLLLFQEKDGTKASHSYSASFLTEACSILLWEIPFHFHVDVKPAHFQENMKLKP